MKKLPLVSLVLFAFLILGSMTGVTAAAERVAGKFAARVVFLVHIAQLYSQDPDKNLAMPVKDVSTKQVANTWHAPRDGDRLHEGQDIFAPQGTPVLSATKGYVANIGQNTPTHHISRRATS
jgi:murein DD-endopeptidase MepM/ murein hydrolase activator NlpD